MRPEEMPHAQLMDEIVRADERAREALVEEALRRLHRAPEPVPPRAVPWDAANGGC